MALGVFVYDKTVTLEKKPFRKKKDNLIKHPSVQ